MLLIMMMKITLKQPAWSLPGILQRWRLTGRGTSQSPVYDNCDGDDGGNNSAVDNKGDDRESTTVYNVGPACWGGSTGWSPPRWLQSTAQNLQLFTIDNDANCGAAMVNLVMMTMMTMIALPSVLAAASKRVAPKNCHLRVHVNRIRTCIFVQMLMMMTNTKVWRRRSQMFENSRSQWRSCPRVLATSRPNSSQDRSDPRFQPGLCKNKHQQIVNIKSYIKKRKIENGFLWTQAVSIKSRGEQFFSQPSINGEYVRFWSGLAPLYFILLEGN